MSCTSCTIYLIVEPVPGCAVVAGTQSLPKTISKNIDLHTKVFLPHVFVKDTTNFFYLFNKIDSLKDVQDILLCTTDVTSVYTNVPHTEGLEALKQFLDRRESFTTPTFLVKMTELILKRNYFKFEDSYYLQLQGVQLVHLTYSWVNLRRILSIIKICFSLFLSVGFVILMIFFSFFQVHLLNLRNLLI